MGPSVQGGAVGPSGRGLIMLSLDVFIAAFPLPLPLSLGFPFPSRLPLSYARFLPFSLFFLYKLLYFLFFKKLLTLNGL